MSPTRHTEIGCTVHGRDFEVYAYQREPDDAVWFAGIYDATDGDEWPADEVYHVTPARALAAAVQTIIETLDDQANGYGDTPDGEPPY